MALTARTYIDASLTYGLPTMHISSAFSLADLWEATQSYKRLPSDLVNMDAVADMFAVRVTGTTVQPCVPDTAQQVKRTYQVGIAACSCNAVCYKTRHLHMF